MTSAPLAPLLDQLAAGRDLTAIRELVTAGTADGSGGDMVASTGLFPFAVADLARTATAESPLVVVTPTTRSAEDLRAALSSLVGTEHLAELPAWETLPHERLSPRADTVARRLATLRRVAHPETERPVHVLLLPVRSLLQPIAAPAAVSSRCAAASSTSSRPPSRIRCAWTSSATRWTTSAGSPSPTSAPSSPSRTGSTPRPAARSC